jgi:predicted DNA-binding transcriptional regulator AlpA
VKLTMNVAELASALSLSERTIRLYSATKPHLLPPKLNLPVKRLVWAIEDVRQWVEAHREKSAAS